MHNTYQQYSWVGAYAQFPWPTKEVILRLGKSSLHFSDDLTKLGWTYFVK